MESKSLIEKFRLAFGEKAPLPIAISYTDAPVREPEEKMHCMMNYLIKAKEGLATSMTGSTIYCRGGKVYTGFAEMNEGVRKFVSGIEKYKDTPDNVQAFVDAMQIVAPARPYVTFQRIDQLENLNETEGVVVFATPDILAGLWSWANFDLNDEDAVIANFGSGCSSTIANMVRENRNNGHRCFIAMLDITVRPMMDPNEVVFAIPRVRLEKMIETFDQTCLAGAPAWEKVRNRIIEE